MSAVEDVLLNFALPWMLGALAVLLYFEWRARQELDRDRKVVDDWFERNPGMRERVDRYDTYEEFRNSPEAREFDRYLRETRQ